MHAMWKRELDTYDDKEHAPDVLVANPVSSGQQNDNRNRNRDDGEDELQV